MIVGVTRLMAPRVSRKPWRPPYHGRARRSARGVQVAVQGLRRLSLQTVHFVRPRAWSALWDAQVLRAVMAIPLALGGGSGAVARRTRRRADGGAIGR